MSYTTESQGMGSVDSENWLNLSPQYASRSGARACLCVKQPSRYNPVSSNQLAALLIE